MSPTRAGAEGAAAWADLSFRGRRDFDRAMKGSAGVAAGSLDALMQPVPPEKIFEAAKAPGTESWEQVVWETEGLRWAAAAAQRARRAALSARRGAG